MMRAKILVLILVVSLSGISASTAQLVFPTRKPLLQFDEKDISASGHDIQQMKAYELDRFRDLFAACLTFYRYGVGAEYDCLFRIEQYRLEFASGRTIDTVLLDYRLVQTSQISNVGLDKSSEQITRWLQKLHDTWDFSIKVSYQERRKKLGLSD